MRPHCLVHLTMRRPIFDNLHSCWYPGIKASRLLVWPNINGEIVAWKGTFHDCQQWKVQRSFKTPLTADPAPDCPFDSNHVEIVSPQPPTKGYTYLFIYSDWCTSLANHATAEWRASALLFDRVTCFSVPTKIISDRGQQFESEVWCGSPIPLSRLCL